MKNILKYSRLGFVSILALFMTLSFVSCEDDYDPGQTNLSAMSGKWYVQKYNKTAGVYTPVEQDKYFIIRTYNTAENVNTKMYIEDRSKDKNFSKQIVEVMYGDLSFKSASGQAEQFSSGKVFPNLGRSKTKVITDSIYFEITRNGATEIYGGHMYTGFSDDNYN